jgi:hypothetical protein
MLAHALDEIRTLEALVADLKRIAAGQAPTLADLEQAPLLVGWEQSTRLASCLAGIAVDHPLLGSQPVTTSQIWAANFVGQDGLHRWARTYSRWYRLGASRKELGETL